MEPGRAENVYRLNIMTDGRRDMAQKSTTQDDIDQLSAQISALKDDIAAISGTLGDLGHSSRQAASAQASETAAHLQQAGRKKLDDAQDVAEDLGRRAGEAVHNQPMATMGLAVGIGFLLGFMSGRK